MTASVVYVTTANRDEALAIARTLVAERLAACANVLGDVTSVYLWDDAVQEDAEVVVILKTRTELVEAVTRRVVELHSYDCPCITSWPITHGHPPYLGWIAAETKGQNGG